MTETKEKCVFCTNSEKPTNTRQCTDTADNLVEREFCQECEDHLDMQFAEGWESRVIVP